MRIVDLEEAINEKRDEMIKIGMTKGLSNKETIICSQELDNLLNEYRRLTVNQGRPKTGVLLDEFVEIIQHFYKLVARPYRLLSPYKSNRF
ncbi:aspartyl-phosphate phosphatase Spo0E family protein [Neobacillus niacini]|uniref:aspartyl-phosphate phosphatase Spo0E family protein n=1 Tax=Neobacillus niacini TaxID=86668 RepID=UPI003983566F